MGLRPFDCEHCSNNYAKVQHLKRHLLAAHKHLMQTWLCDECPREYLSQRSLIGHKMKTHASAAEMVRLNAEAAAASELLQQQQLLPPPPPAPDEIGQGLRVVVERVPQPDANIELIDLFVL